MGHQACYNIKKYLKEKGINSFIIDAELVPFYDDIRQFTNVRKVNGQWIKFKIERMCL